MVDQWFRYLCRIVILLWLGVNTGGYFLCTTGFGYERNYWEGMYNSAHLLNWIFFPFIKDC